MIPWRTGKLFWQHNKLYLCVIVVLSSLSFEPSQRHLPATWPSWLGWVVFLAVVISLVGLMLVMQVIRARRVTGHPSLRLLWEFWALDAAFKHMPVGSQRDAYERRFGTLSPADVERVCRKWVEMRGRTLPRQAVSATRAAIPRVLY